MKEKYADCMVDTNCYYAFENYKKCVATCLPPSYIHGANKNVTLTPS